MATDDRNPQRIRMLLQDAEVQGRVRENIRKGQEETKVTIGRASELFSIRPSKLRELDELLQPKRSTGTETGQRQYSLTELKKLAIISGLLKEGCTTSEIPFDIDRIWQEVIGSETEQELEESEDHLSIDSRIEQAHQEKFWRYFASHILYMSLTLIYEEIYDTIIGIILPLKRKGSAASILDPQALRTLGECLIGWLDQNHTFYTLYDPAPFFEYPSDFRVRGLQAVEESGPTDSTYLVLQRKAKPLALSTPVVATIRRLLTPLYEDVTDWHIYFSRAHKRDVVSLATSERDSAGPSDTILNTFADMVVRMGGQIANGQPRWRFCCILVGNNPRLPLPMRSLVVRAQSKNSPHTVGTTIVSPDTPDLSLSLRAFQSSHVIYRQVVSTEDSTIALRTQEEPIGSAIAVPVGGEDDLPVAVLYVVSAEANAFSEEDQRVLRIMARMVSERLMIYQIRQKAAEKLRIAVIEPRVIDELFKEFDSENKFIRDVEALLHDIRRRYTPIGNDEATGSPPGGYDDKREPRISEVLSFISIDIDNQSFLATKYGDHIARNRSRELGKRIRAQIGILFQKHTDCKMYHIYSDRFYLMLNGTSLEQARENADRLRQVLQAPYRVSIQPLTVEQPIVSGDLVELPSITVRLGVTSYTYTKLYEVLQRYSEATAGADVRATILHFLDVALDQAKQGGGNMIVSWYPPEPPKFERGRLAPWSPKSDENGIGKKE